MTARRLYVVVICNEPGYHILYIVELRLQLGIDVILEGTTLISQKDRTWQAVTSLYAFRYIGVLSLCEDNASELAKYFVPGHRALGRFGSLGCLGSLWSPESPWSSGGLPKVCGEPILV